MHKVAFIQNALAHYRVPFFQLLRDRLNDEGIELNLLIGSNFTGHNISGDLDWADKIPVNHFRGFCWMPVLGKLKDADLIIVPQVMKQLWVYPILLRYWLRQQKVAFWGHGKLFSGGRGNRVEAMLKQAISAHCHWWFAYTESVASVIRDEIQFPKDRITVFNNAIDTRTLLNQVVTEAEKEAVRKSLGFTSENIGIFVGGMYHTRILTKRLPFLISSCIEIKKIIPDFQMIFVGGGPEQWLVEEAAAAHTWMHYVGVKKGMDALPYWAVAKVNLNPGLVGLSILDSQALGVPLVTSEVPYHSPEISYLASGVNGLMVQDHDQPKDYATAVADLISDEERRLHMAAAGKKSAENITNEAMVERVTQGILSALACPLSG